MGLSVTIKGGNVVFPGGRRLSIRLMPEQVAIESGSIVLLNGDNGSGKSTFLKTISKVYDDFFDQDRRPKTDEMAAWSRDDKPVQINPRVTQTFGSDGRLRAGYLAQSVRANVFCRSVEDEVAFSLEHSGLSSRETLSRLKTALSDLSAMGIEANRIPHALSKGQQQILGFKSLVQTDPEILFLDEPSAALDERALDWLVEKLHELLRLERVQIVFVVSQDARLIGRLGKSDAVRAINVRGMINESGNEVFVEVGETGRLMTAPLSLSGISSARGKFVVELPDIQMTPGEALVVYGENGSGKSTLLETIAGFKKGETGEIALGNVRLHAGQRECADIVCCAIQNAEEQITFCRSEHELHHPRKLHGWNAACQNLVCGSGINLALSPWRLSFGQRKLLAYYSLVFGAPVLVLDEPFTSLDHNHRGHVVDVANAFLSAGGILIATASRRHNEFDDIQNLRTLELTRL